MKITIYTQNGKNYSSAQAAQFEKAGEIIDKFSVLLYKFDKLKIIKEEIEETEKIFEELQKIATERIKVREIETNENINITDITDIQQS